MTRGMAPTRPRAALLTLAAALTVALTLPLAAGAATATVEGNVLRVTALPGEANQLAVTAAPAPDGSAPGPGAAYFTVTDVGAPLTPGPGCVPSDVGVTCVTASAPTLDVSAGDLDDSVTIGVSAPARVDGGEGDDRLTGGSGPDLLLGGTGADFSDGGSGNDAIEVRDRLSDSAWCGPGRDSVRAELLDFLDTACERVDYGRAGAVGRLATRTGGGSWVPIPGQTWARVDRRILPGVLWMIRRYHVRITEGFAVTGHTRFGEHPLGLAVDIEPGPGGTWADVARLARWAEPRQNRPRFPFRWVGWNGDYNHGHPSICKQRRGCSPHLHLSWSHTPTRPRHLARTVWVFEVR
jgi:hypothetical protein